MSVVPSWVPSMRPGRVQTQDRFDKTAVEVYAAINDPRAWWDGEFEGSTDQVGGCPREPGAKWLGSVSARPSNAADRGDVARI